MIIKKQITHFFAFLYVIVVLLSMGTWETSYADTENETMRQEIDALKQRIETLERLLQAQLSAAPETEPTPEKVELIEDEYSSIDNVIANDSPEVELLAKPWYKRVNLSGFGAVAYIDSGSAGTRPDGGFLIKEASLFVEAPVWDKSSLFFELQTNRLGDDETKWVRTGEVYLHIRDLFPDWGNGMISIKAGRFDIPFGEEYLTQDAIDNPLISTSAAYTYGWDEGVLFYGKYRGIGWAASIADGSDDRSIEDHSDKAFNAKIWGNPMESLYLSASAMRNGTAGKSAIEFGGSHFQPVGVSHPSSLGISPSGKVDAALFELDAKYHFGPYLDSGYLAVNYGMAFVDDETSSFDRDFQWFMIEPYYSLTEQIYLVARYSEIGTYDDNEGYHFDGKTTAGGNSSLGYDTRRFQRLSVGMGWWYNPRLNIKLEYSRDRFDLINGSLLSADNNNRNLFGIEMVGGF